MSQLEKDKERARRALAQSLSGMQRGETASAETPPDETLDQEIQKERNKEIKKSVKFDRTVSVKEPEPMDTFSNKIRVSLHTRLKVRAVQERRTIQDILDEALERYLAE